MSANTVVSFLHKEALHAYELFPCTAYPEPLRTWWKLWS